MMSSLLSAVDALRASSGKKRGWPSTEKGASILGKVSYFLLFEMTISFGLRSIPLEEKTSQIDHHELHAALI